MPAPNSDKLWRLGFGLANLVVVVGGVLAAYFLTIQSLKVELAAKAEGLVVAALDKRLGQFEIRLSEGVVGKEEFYQFARETEARLVRIEYYLIEESGDQRETP